MKIEQYNELFFMYYPAEDTINFLLFLYLFSLFIFWGILKVNPICHTTLSVNTTLAFLLNR